MTGLPFWAPLALLGFAPWMIVVQKSINLLYQYWIHTEKIVKLPRWFEFVFNTPSHHRVHHGSDEKYLDRNHAGILIVWDRMFGTFQEEEERPAYGLTKNIGTFNPLRVASHELVAIVRDARSAPDRATLFGYVFRGPGWKPAGAASGDGAAVAEPA
jgi:sterol desaturase/sphingolipid hydroxylase (fatty acid hydroxylase superfamily)